MKSPLKVMTWLMAVLSVGLAFTITVHEANLKKTVPEGSMLWSRLEHQLLETDVIETDSVIQVNYFNLDAPFFMALYHKGEDHAFQLGVDMDQNLIPDFTVCDLNKDGYLDFNLIFTHEHPEETLRRAKLLLQGKLILEKTL